MARNWRTLKVHQLGSFTLVQSSFYSHQDTEANFSWPHLTQSTSPNPIASRFGLQYEVWWDTIPSKAETKARGTKRNYGKTRFQQMGCRALVWINSGVKMLMFLQKLPIHSCCIGKAVLFEGTGLAGVQPHIWFRILHTDLFTCSHRSRHSESRSTDQAPRWIPFVVFFLRLETAELRAIMMEGIPAAPS